MAQIIEIEGESVRVITREIVHNASLAEVLPLIERRPDFGMLIPRTAIYYSERTPESLSGAREVGFLCELPPSVRYITKSNRRYRLSMPWTYFWFTFVNGHTENLLNNEGMYWQMGDHRVFHAKEKVTSIESILFTAFLPNVYEDGRICFGSTGADSTLPLQNRIDTLVNEWYSSDFNNDVHGGRNHPLPFNERLPLGWRTWVEATREFGLSAYLRFPEWDLNTTTAPYFDVRQIMAGRRHDPIVVQDAIPELQLPASFGRSAEWLQQLPDNRARRRLAMAIQELQVTNPELFELTAAEAAQITTNIGDDGGEPLP